MRDKELRLALVCYGGISLAVYMHGITKEIWRVARASRACRDGEPPASGSQGVYRMLFEEVMERSNLRLRLFVDIIAGASAGGINGVFLGQAIATGQSLEPLTDLWLDTADVEALLAPEARPSSRLAKFWATPIAWMAMGSGKTIEETVEVDAREEVRKKLETFVRSRWFEPPFGGKQLLHLMLNALDAMAAAPAEKRLLPGDQPLDLFVTVTDFLGHPEKLRMNSPPEAIETEHRLVFPFSSNVDSDDPIAHSAELAFAARATSSFPGAFPAFSVRELDEVLAERNQQWPGRNAFLERMLPRKYAAGDAEDVALIDGSVLANAPFRPAIEALRERPARRQVDRRFVFIDPTPGHRIGLYGDPRKRPGFFQTILGALSDLPREQPIRDNLEDIANRSARIEQINAIIAKLRDEVESQVESLFGYTLFLDYPTPRRLAGWRRRAQIAAAAKAGYGHAAYGLLKVAGIVDRQAKLLYHIGEQPGPERLRQIRAAVNRTIESRGWNDFGTNYPTGASATTLGFLRDFDLGFRVRRLRLLARRVTELDTESEQAELLPIREAIYGSLAAYLEFQRSDTFADLRDMVRAIDEDADAAIDALGERMNLTAIDAATDARLSDGFSQLSRDWRRPILLAHLGFPFFDIATMPLLHEEAGLNEFDPIRVDRISPDDATAIRSGVRATLKGIQFNSFGAFFSRAYRENDYLWGRLHGADRLIDILLSTLPASGSFPEARVAEIKRAAFHAILDEEEARLTRIPRLFEALRKEIG